MTSLLWVIVKVGALPALFVSWLSFEWLSGVRPFRRVLAAVLFGVATLLATGGSVVAMFFMAGPGSGGFLSEFWPYLLVGACLALVGFGIGRRPTGNGPGVR